MKKFWAVVMVLTMICSVLSVPAFAETAQSVLSDQENAGEYCVGGVLPWTRDDLELLRGHYGGFPIHLEDVKERSPETLALMYELDLDQYFDFVLPDTQEEVFEISDWFRQEVQKKADVMQAVQEFKTKHATGTIAYNDVKDLTLEEIVLLYDAGLNRNFDFEFNSETAAVLRAVAALEQPKSPQNFIPLDIQIGDVNADGKINASDAREVLRMAAKMDIRSAYQSVLADVNKDGKVQSSDARTILQYAAHLIEKLS